MDSFTEQNLVETDSFCISFLGGRKKAIKESEHAQAAKWVQLSPKGSNKGISWCTIQVQGNFHSSLNQKKELLCDSKLIVGWALLALIIWLCHSKKIQFPSWLYAARVSSKDESACPVRYHQQPRAPADLFAEFIEATRALNMLLMNQKYGAQVW